MNALTAVDRNPDMRDRVSEAEWNTRVELAACYRLVAHYGMSDLIYNHITAKVPDSSGHFLINPFGLLYTEITASNLYKIDLDCNVVLQPDTSFGINRAGFLIHSAIHRARPDIACVMHTHTRAGTAISGMQDGLLPLTQTAMRFYGAIGYHDYEVPTADVGERERIAADLGPHYAMVMRNHGLIACGRSVPDAWNLMYWLETACRTQIDMLASGAKLAMPSHELATKIAHRYSADGPMQFSQMEWPALMREMDRVDPSFRN